MDDIKESRINARQIKMRVLTEDEYLATNDEVSRNTEKSCLRHSVANMSNGGSWIFYNGYIYQYKYGIDVGLDSGTKHYIPSTEGRRKRGVVSGFSSHSRRRLKIAILSSDLPNGSWKCGATFLLPWDEVRWDGEVLNDFRASVEAFRTSFTRCFPRCAIIYRVEVTKKGTEHIHAIFYAPHDDEWITRAYTYVMKSRIEADKKEFVGDIHSTMNDNAKMELLQKIISVLWFIAISRRPITESARLQYWERGVRVKPVKTMSQMIQYMSSVSSKSKKLQSRLKARQWGVLQKKNLVRNKPHRVEVYGRIRVLFLRCISRLRRKRLSRGRHSLSPFGWHHSKRVEAIGVIPGITKELTNKILAWAENEVMSSPPMDYVVPYRPRDLNNKDATLFKQYQAIS